MKTPTVQEIKASLKNLSAAENTELILRLAKFKKENKELLTYLLYYSQDEQLFITEIKTELKEEFSGVNRTNLYQAKKTIRKILRIINKYCRYSTVKQTEIELRIYFCNELHHLNIDFKRSQLLLNLYTGQLKKIKIVLATLHEDLQFDYADDVNRL
jgi:hypothetical protein